MFNSNAYNFLLSTQNEDGGWGYTPQAASVTESSAAALLALTKMQPVSDAGTAALQRGVAWLLAGQHKDGGWGFAHNDPESTWQTAWAVWALTKVGPGTPALEAGVNWLVTPSIVSTGDDAMASELKQNSGIDLNINGWPWLPGELPWLEPSAHALLALHAVPSSEAVQTRLRDGVRLLRSRHLDAGGWNIGVIQMLGAIMPPRPVPTALAILTLALLEPQEIQAADYFVLQQQTDQDGGVLALSWTVMALRIAKQPSDVFAAQLESSQIEDGSWNRSMYQTSLALLSLGELDWLR
jgi:hypothetical protein